MSEQTNTASAEAGSANELIQQSPSANGGELEGNSTAGENSTVTDEQYRNLEKKLGEMGTELGDYRKFFGDITPILEALQDNPHITDAIMAGKITPELAEALVEGKVKIEDAAVVAQAHENVKEKIGEKAYEAATPEKIEEMTRRAAEKIAIEMEERRSFEDKITNFVKNTDDYAEYADKITDWFNENPNQYDIEVAYWTVKGKSLAEQGQQTAAENAAEEAKKIALNAGGGSSQGGTLVNGQDTIDALISGRSNPNQI